MMLGKLVNYYPYCLVEVRAIDEPGIGLNYSANMR